MASLTTHLEQLTNAQLVRKAPDEELAYLFKHALTQEVTYDSLLLKKRREVHQRVAQAYEASYGDRLDEFAALLAQHYQAAGNDTKTVEYAIRAGDHAARLGAESVALAHYGLAIQLLPSLPDTAENRRAHIDTLIKHTAISFVSASPEQSLANLRQAESLVEGLLKTESTLPEDRLRLARVQMWNTRIHYFRQERRAALEDFYRMLPVALELGDQEFIDLSRTMIARIWLWGGAFNRALPLLQQVLPSLEQRENWTEWTLNNSLVGVALAALGNYHGGIAEAERTLKHARELNHLNGICVGYSMLAVVHLMGGVIQPALEVSRATLEIALPAGIIYPSYMAWGTRAWAESRLGQHQAARESMAQAEAIARKSGRLLFLEDWFAAIRIEMALNAGDIKEVLTLAEKATSVFRSVDGKFAEGLAQRACGEARRIMSPSSREKVETHYRSSLELFLSGGAVLEAARTHVAWGRFLQSLDQAEEARQHFEQAFAQFESSRLLGELEETRRLMA